MDVATSHNIHNLHKHLKVNDEPLWCLGNVVFPHHLVSGQGTSTASHPRVMSSFLPTRLGYWDRRRAKFETWVSALTLILLNHFF